jgi:hypothetical protein
MRIHRLSRDVHKVLFLQCPLPDLLILLREIWFDKVPLVECQQIVERLDGSCDSVPRKVQHQYIAMSCVIKRVNRGTKVPKVESRNE